MKLTRREKILLIVLLFTIITALYYSLFYVNYSSELAEVNTVISDLKTDIASYEMKSRFLNRMRENVSELENEVNSYIEKNVSSDYDPGLMLVYLQDMFRRYEASQMLVEFSEPIVGEYFNSVDLVLRFESNYQVAKNIIDEIENGEYKQFVNSVSFINKGAGGTINDGELNVTVSFSLVYCDGSVEENVEP